jgi:hypothetical protein
VSRRGKKRVLARGEASARLSGRPPPAERLRTSPELHVLTARHLDLFAGVAQARPDLAELLDLGQFEEGCESIEVLSQRAHEHLVARGLDNALFSALCELNVERVHAAIRLHLDEVGIPLDEEALLGDLFSRLHRWYFAVARKSPSRSASDESAAFERMGRGTTVMRGLIEVARQIVAERLRMLAASAVPLPAAPSPAVAVADALVLDTARALGESRHRLRVGDLRRWITFALLQLPGVERRLIHLRNRRELSFREIAERVGLTPFDAGIRLKRAIVTLHETIDRLLRTHESGTDGSEREPEPVPAGGRLLELRPRASNRAPESVRDPSETQATSDREEGDDE